MKLTYYNTFLVSEGLKLSCEYDIDDIEPCGIFGVSYAPMFIFTRRNNELPHELLFQSSSSHFRQKNTD